MALETPPLSLGPGTLPSRGSGGRLGIDSRAGAWPATPPLKSYEAAGFGFLQVRMPPAAVLADPALLCAHACALRDSLRLSDLQLVLHMPEGLYAGWGMHDRLLEAALEYAALAGCDLVVYHGAHMPIGSTGVHVRAGDEVRSLQALAARAGLLGVRIAVENLAPAYAGAERISHDPLAVARLVRAVGSDHVGLCLDLGHAYIAAGLAGCGVLELVEPVLGEVILFEAHDNFGARADAPRAGGIEPLRLDLHLAPGAGSVPWAELAPLLARHDAPIQLEIHPAGRPEPARLATVMCELLGLSSAVGYPSAGA